MDTESFVGIVFFIALLIVVNAAYNVHPLLAFAAFIAGILAVIVAYEKKWPWQ